MGERHAFQISFDHRLSIKAIASDWIGMSERGLGIGVTVFEVVAAESHVFISCIRRSVSEVPFSELFEVGLLRTDRSLGEI